MQIGIGHEIRVGWVGVCWWCVGCCWQGHFNGGFGAGAVLWGLGFAGLLLGSFFSISALTLDTDFGVTSFSGFTILEQHRRLLRVFLKRFSYSLTFFDQ